MQEEEEENLAHFEMTEQAFDVAAATSSSSSSVQTPVISQVSSTMNHDSRPSACIAQNSPGSRAGYGSEDGTAGEEAKNAVTSLPETEQEEREKDGEGQNQKKALVSITIEWEAFHLILLEFVYVFYRSCGLNQYIMLKK